MTYLAGGVAVLEPDAADELLTASAEVLATRSQLEVLLLEALAAPGMALDQIDQIDRMRPALERGQAALTRLTQQRRRGRR